MQTPMQAPTQALTQPPEPQPPPPGALAMTPPQEEQFKQQLQGERSARERLQSGTRAEMGMRRSV